MSPRTLYKRFRLTLRLRKLRGTTELVVSAPDKHVAISIVLGSCPEAEIARIVLDATGGCK